MFQILGVLTFSVISAFDMPFENMCGGEKGV